MIVCVVGSVLFGRWWLVMSMLMLCVFVVLMLVMFVILLLMVISRLGWCVAVSLMILGVRL